MVATARRNSSVFPTSVNPGTDSGSAPTTDLAEERTTDFEQTPRLPGRVGARPQATAPQNQDLAPEAEARRSALESLPAGQDFIALANTLAQNAAPNATSATESLQRVNQLALTRQGQEVDSSSITNEIVTEVWKSLLGDQALSQIIVEAIATELDLGIDPRDPFEFLNRHPEIIGLVENPRTLVQSLNQLQTRISENTFKIAATEQDDIQRLATTKLHQSYQHELARELEQLREFKFTGAAGELKEFLELSKELRTKVSSLGQRELRDFQQNNPQLIDQLISTPEEAFSKVVTELQEEVDSLAQRHIAEHLAQLALNDSYLDLAEKFGEFLPYVTSNVGSRHPNDFYNLHLAQDLEVAHPELIPGLDHEYGIRGGDFDFLQAIKQAQTINSAIIRVRQSQFAQLDQLQITLEEKLRPLNSDALGVSVIEDSSFSGVSLQITAPVSLQALAQHVFQKSDARELSNNHYRLLAESNPELTEVFAQLQHKAPSEITIPVGSFGLAMTPIGSQARAIQTRISLALTKLAEPIARDEIIAEARTDSTHQRRELELEQLKVTLAQDGFKISENLVSQAPSVTLLESKTLAEVAQRVLGIRAETEIRPERLFELVELNPHLKPFVDKLFLGEKADEVNIPNGADIVLPRHSGMAATISSTNPPGFIDLHQRTQNIIQEVTRRGLDIRITPEGNVVASINRELLATNELVQIVSPNGIRFGELKESAVEWLKSQKLPSDIAIGIPHGREFSLNQTPLGRSILQARQEEHQLLAAISSRLTAEDRFRQVGLEPLVSTELTSLKVRTTRPVTLAEIAGVYPGTETTRFSERVLTQNPSLRPYLEQAKARLPSGSNLEVGKVEIPAGIILSFEDAHLTRLARESATTSPGYAREEEFQFIQSDSHAGLSDIETEIVLSHEAGTINYLNQANQLETSASLRENIAAAFALIPQAGLQADVETELGAQIARLERSINQIKNDPQLSLFHHQVIEEFSTLRIQASSALGNFHLQRGNHLQARSYYQQLKTSLSQRLHELGSTEISSQGTIEEITALRKLNVTTELNLARISAAESSLPEEFLKLVQERTITREEARSRLAPLIDQLNSHLYAASQNIPDGADKVQHQKALFIEQQRLIADVYGRLGDLELRHAHLTQAASTLLNSAESLSESPNTQLFNSETGQIENSLISQIWSGQRISSFSEQQLTSLSGDYAKLDEVSKLHLLDLLEQLSATAGQMQNENSANLHFQLFEKLLTEHHNSESFSDRALKVRLEIIHANKLLAQSEDSLPMAMQRLYHAESLTREMFSPESAGNELRQLTQKLSSTTDAGELELLTARIKELREQTRQHEVLLQGIYSSELNILTQRNSLLRDPQSAEEVTSVVARVVNREQQRIDTLNRERESLLAERQASIDKLLEPIHPSRRDEFRTQTEAEFQQTERGKLVTAQISALDSEIRFRQRSQAELRLREVLAYVNSSTAKRDSTGGSLNAQQMLDQLERDFADSAIATETSKIVSNFRSANSEGKLAVLKQALHEVNSSSLAETLVWTQTSGLAGAGIASIIATPAAAPVGYGVGNFVGWAGLSIKNLVVGQERISQAYQTGLTTISDTETILNGVSVGLEAIPFGGGAISGARRIGTEGLQAIISPQLLARQIQRVALQSGREIALDDAVRLARTTIINQFGREMFEFGGKALAYGGLSFSLAPAAYQLIDIRNNPNLTDHQKQRMSSEVYRQLATLALNVAVTSGVQRGIGAASAQDQLLISQIRAGLLDSRLRTQAETEAVSAIESVASPSGVANLQTQRLPEEGSHTLAARITSQGSSVGLTGGQPLAQTHLVQANGIARRLASEQNVFVAPKVELANGQPSYDAAFDWVNNRILVNPNVDPARLPELIAHEMEHAHQIQFIAAAHLSGRTLPDNFYQRGENGQVLDTSNINPDILAAVSTRPSDPSVGDGPRYYQSEMISVWGEKLAHSLAVAADLHGSGKIDEYRGQFAEVTAQIGELETRKQVLVERHNELVEQTLGSSDQVQTQELVNIQREIGEIDTTIATHLETIHGRLAARQLDPASARRLAGTTSGEGLAYSGQALSEDDVVELLDTYQSEPEIFEQADRAELYWNLRDRGLLGLADDVGALEVAAIKELELDVNRIHSKSLGEQLELSRRLKVQGIFESQDESVRLSLGRSESISQSLSRFKSDPQSLTQKERAELYWQLDEQSLQSRTLNTAELRTAAISELTAEFTRLEQNPSAYNIQGLMELNAKIRSLGIGESVPAKAASILSDAAELSFYSDFLASDLELNSTEFSRFVELMTAPQTRDSLLLEELIGPTHPQYQSLTQAISTRKQQINELQNPSPSEPAELQSGIFSTLSDMVASSHTLRFGAVIGEGGAIAREKLITGEGQATPGLLAKAQSRVEQGINSNLLSAFEAEVNEQIAAIKAQKPVPTEKVAEVMRLTEISESIGIYRSKLQAEARTRLEQEQRRVAQANQSLIPDSGPDLDTDLDTDTDPVELTAYPRAAERREPQVLAAADLQVGKVYYSEHSGWMRILSKRENGSMEVLLLRDRPGTEASRYGAQRVTLPQPLGRYVTQRDIDGFAHMLGQEKGLTHDRAALWFGTGELYQQMVIDGRMVSRAGEVFFASKSPKYDHYNQILQSLAPDEKLGPFLARLRDGIVNGPVNEQDLALGRELLVAIRDQTSIDYVMVGAERQAARNARGSFHFFEAAYEPALFEGRVDVSRVGRQVDDYYRTEMWELGVQALEGNFQYTDARPERLADTRRVSLNTYYASRDPRQAADPFSQRMVELENNPTPGRARQIVQDSLPEIKDFLDRNRALVDGREVIVVEVPSSTRAPGAPSRSSVLASELAKALNFRRAPNVVEHYDQVDTRAVSGLSGTRTIGSQKFQGGLLDRMRNNGAAFDLRSDVRLNPDQVVILVDDIATTDVTLTAVRERLQPAEVLVITFGQTPRR